MAKRKGLSKRLRFEVFKRDGFICAYCGGNPMENALRVDHVIPVSKGGGNEPENLITACFDCNSGKSDILLNVKKFKPVKIEEHQTDHVDQIKEYLNVQKKVKEEKERVTWIIADYWIENIGQISKEGFSRLSNVLKQIPPYKIFEAIDITAAKMGCPESDYDYYMSTKQVKYFNGILRNWRAE